MDEIELLVDLHKTSYRQGPGGDDETLQAMNLAGLDRSVPLRMADIGCGTGATTRLLARSLNAEITAVDFMQPFLEVLTIAAERDGVGDKITTLCASMEQLPFDDETFDVIWSEGAIYNMGFAKGVAQWQRYLKPGGVLVVSEITWLTEDRPETLQTFWKSAYPEIDTASAKIKQLVETGYSPLGYFVLPERCWLDHYYDPVHAEIEAFLDRHRGSDAARAIVEAEQQERALYEKYKDYYSYGVYVAKKPV